MKLTTALLGCLALLVIGCSLDAPNATKLCGRRRHWYEKLAKRLSAMINRGIVECFVPSILPWLITLIAALDCQLHACSLPFVPDELNGDYLGRCNKPAMWVIFVASFMLVFYLGIEKLSGQGIHRMRHAIAMLALLGLVITSVTIYGWGWLHQDNSSNSATVQHIALGVAALLTVVFLIWREKIASEKVFSDQYADAVRMLSSPNAATQTAGIHILEDLGRYSEKGLPVLKAFVNHPPQGHLSLSSSSRRAVVQEANRVIDRWRKQS